MENWKDVRDYEGHYMISDSGRVKSLKNAIIMKPEVMKLGYLRIQLSKEGRYKKIMIHRLVAVAFLGPMPENFEVNHIDENKANNHVLNLEWVTKKQNMTRGSVQKRRKKAMNPHVLKTQKPVYQFDSSGDLIKKWPSLNSVKEAGFSSGNVSMYCNGKYSSDLYRGFIWSFNEQISLV